MIVSSVIYYSLKSRNDSYAYVWIIVFIAATIFQSVINHKLYKRSKTKIVYMDMLFVLWVIFIPRIYLPYGISRLIMAVIGTFYAFIVSNKKYLS